MFKGYLHLKCFKQILKLNNITVQLPAWQYGSSYLGHVLFYE